MTCREKERRGKYNARKVAELLWNRTKEEEKNERKIISRRGRTIRRRRRKGKE